MFAAPFLLTLLFSSRIQAAEGTTTPIRNLIVIFQENASFDHYFGAYPNALNPPDEPAFYPREDLPTPSVNGLNPALLKRNPNAEQPFRMKRSQAVTCSQSHDYTREQKAYNAGLVDKFVENTSSFSSSCDQGLGRKIVMGYYDGNTVTAYWNYAQYFAMSDNYFSSTFGPSTPGALNLISGQTHGARVVRDVGNIATLIAGGSVTGDIRPALDDCTATNLSTVTMEGRNIGDLLNEQGITWGWFQGGFTPSSRNTDGTAVCATAHKNVAGTSTADYVPHHQPFQYYASTANQHHLPPTAVDKVGLTDQANHQYDLDDFFRAAKAGRLPAVSFLKAASYQDGHPSNSSPLDEQTFVVNTVNTLMDLPEWDNMAILIAYDDSDGWYDHVMPPIVNQSATSLDALTATGACGVAKEGLYQGRCGFGPRMPLLLISPWAKSNYADHTIIDQASITRFIEDNWSLGRIGDQSFDENAGSLLGLFDFRDTIERTARLYLDPDTGSIH